MDRLEITGERMPDCLEKHNEQALKAFPYGPDIFARGAFTFLR